VYNVTSNLWAHSILKSSFFSYNKWEYLPHRCPDQGLDFNSILNRTICFLLCFLLKLLVGLWLKINQKPWIKTLSNQEYESCQKTCYKICILINVSDKDKFKGFDIIRLYLILFSNTRIYLCNCLKFLVKYFHPSLNATTL